MRLSCLQRHVIVLLFWGLVSWCAFAVGQVINEVPPTPTGPDRFVTDLGHLIPDEQEPGLNAYLDRLSRSGAAQMAILTLPDTERDLSAMSPLVMNAWGLGDQEKDNGILILANAKRIQQNLSGNRIFVGTGYGVEGVLPDAVVGRVLDEQALPAFQNKTYSQGIINTAVALANLVQGDAQTIEQYSHPATQNEMPPWAFFMIILVILILHWMGVPIYIGGGGFGSGGGGFGGGFGGGRSGGGGAGR